MAENDKNGKLIETTALCAQYCRTLEECRNMDKEDFIVAMLDLLPRIYLEFSIPLDETFQQFEEEASYFSSYIDEDYYEGIRRNVEILLGPEDSFLETFEEDMKYSDTPIASSISECLADIFQPVYNFISVVRETDGESAEAAYMECRENFESYWSQTLCNVLRAVNYLRYNR